MKLKCVILKRSKSDFLQNVQCMISKWWILVVIEKSGLYVLFSALVIFW